MPSNLPPVPHRQPIIDQGGFMTPIWSDWFQKVFYRVGGNVAETNDELAIVGTSNLVDGSVTAAKIAAAVAGNGLSGGAGTALAVNVDGTTVEINSDALRVKDSGISTPKVADGAISFIKQLSTDWTNSAAASGYLKLPSGLYIQWGVTGAFATATSTSVSLPIAFPTNCFQVISGVRDNSAVAVGSTGQWGTGNYSTSTFTLYNRTSVTLTFNWIAVGN